MNLKLKLEDGSFVDARGDEEGRLVVSSQSSAPVEVNAARPLRVARSPMIMDMSGSSDNSAGITTSSVNYKLPTPGGFYYLKAIGNSCYIQDGEDPTATVGGPGCCVCEGETFGPVKLAGPYVAVIGSATTGYLYFMEAVDI